MNKKADINEYIQAFLSSPRLGGLVVYQKEIPRIPASLRNPEKAWPQKLKKVIEGCGISELYSHQATAMDLIRSGRHVVAATPTASGKTLNYNLPVLERIIHTPDTKGLYLFPLKALAQDQLRNFRKMCSFLPDPKPHAAIYDGDTTAWFRKKIRENPPHVIMTNPDMLHLSFLPHHEKWAEFFKTLAFVVIDEVHTYRGIMGSHMAQVFRRFKRLCIHYGSSPTYVFNSATIANPGELAKNLTGLDAEVIVESGAPQGKKHIVFINPIEGPARTTILLLKAALARNLRTIVYTQSRRFAELIAIWAGSKAGPYTRRIRAYRAGFLPEERREIEAKLASGELLAVISTSALELGIDIGDLDLCLLVGYPGSIMATWQRGGRVGRSGQDSAWVLIAGDDALDQYFMRNPEALLEKEPEKAVINPENPAILGKHLLCAAAELPLSINEPFLSSKPVVAEVTALEESGSLLRGEEGDTFYSKRKHPHREINLRGTGYSFNIICSQTGEHKGEIDSLRAFRETHPGAIYLHQGDSFIVDTLDLDTMTVKVTRADVDYYTRVIGDKDIEILEVVDEKKAWGTTVYWGRLEITDRVTGYERWQISNHRRINQIALDLPPQIFETEGFWIKVPYEVQKAAVKNAGHITGGLHAIEHAAIGVFPVFILADRNDLGGLAITFHPQTESAAVFIYDGIPGGGGFSRQAFEKAEALFSLTLKVIQDCPCESGCPACVHSPRCGSGNRPIDKQGAMVLLEQMQARQKADRPGRQNKQKKRVKPVFSVPSRKKAGDPKQKRQKKPLHYGVFDIETQRSAQEVGGWHKAAWMGISCIVLYDSETDKFHEYLEDQVQEFIERIKKLELVIGFNNRRFDNQVLSGYSDFNFNSLPTLDILEEIHNRLGFRLSLDNLASITLGTKKSADGLQALLWWKQSKIREIIDYCAKDVLITRDLYLFGKNNGYLLFENKAGQKMRIPVDW